MKKVVVTHWVHNEIIDYLNTFCEPILNQTKNTLTNTEIQNRCRNANAMMAFMPDCVDANFLDSCPNLEIIAGALKGFDNFDVEACTERGIWFTKVPDLLTDPTAELTIGLMIDLARHTRQADAYVRDQKFSGWKPVFYGKSLNNASVGIIGFGAVGQSIAKKLKGFNCNVNYFDKLRPPIAETATGVSYQELDQLLKVNDFIVSVLPLNSDTHHLLNFEKLNLCKPGALLINTGRGSVVDEEAVLNLLNNKKLGGYAADVFEFEDWALTERPKKINSDLLNPELNTVYTPHLGSAVDTTRLNIAMAAAKNIEQVFKGGTPEDSVNSVAS